MIKKLISTCCLLPMATNIFSQTTLVLQPDASTGNDAYVWDYQPNTNYGTITGLDITAWTASGTPYISRAFLQFDLSSIPAVAVITSAHLSLYHNSTATSYNGIHNGANESFLQRVTGNWQQNTINWNNQPTTTTMNQLSLPATTSGTQDFTNLDVTNLVADMVANPATSFGFMLRLQTEQEYRDLLFGSSEHPNAALHPKLEITYDTNVTCLTKQPNATDGKDAYVWDYNPSTNYGNADGLDVTAWTASGTPYISRVFLQFDLSSIPTNASIVSAKLSLYHNNTASGYNGIHNGANESFIRQVTSNWQENTITWNNQPTTTSVNEIYLPATTSGTQDFLDVDVRGIVTGMVSNPGINYGFSMVLQTEQSYRDLLFGASEHPNSSLHPKLEVCYSVPTAIHNINNSTASLSFYPNPLHTVSTLKIEDPSSALRDIVINDLAGKVVFEELKSAKKEFKLESKNFQSGFYFVRVISETGEVQTLKFAAE